MTESDEIGHNALTHLLRGLEVRGSVNTKQKCPVCHAKFKFYSDKLEFHCELHPYARPTRYYINGKPFGLGHIYSNPQTHTVFETYSQALDVLLAINRDFKLVNYDKRQFAQKYGGSWIPQKVLENRIENVCRKFLINHEAEANKGAKGKEWVRKLVNICNTFIIDYFKGRDINDISEGDTENFYHFLLELGYSSDYIDTILGVLKSLFLKYRTSDIPKFPSFTVVPVHEKQRLGFAREIATIEKVPDRHGYRLAILVLLRTGMRINEVVAIKVHDLDDGTIYVTKAISDNVLKLTRKDGGEVLYSVSPEIWQLILNHIKGKQPDDFVFEIEGRPIPTRRLYKVWTAACRKANVKHICLRQASRHSKASEIYQKHKKRALQEVSEQLGHSNTTTGKKHYVIEE